MLTRIFQNLGASLENVPLLWLAGPITGLIVQPLVGLLLGSNLDAVRAAPALFPRRGDAGRGRTDRDAECHDVVDRGIVVMAARCVA